jgi:predicted O-linked N-acetylglucosamine transferase (SPINDLY family)
MQTKQNKPKIPPGSIERAVILHRLERLDEAERHCLSILKIDPNHFEASHLLGVIYHKQGRFSESAELIAAALQVFPQSAEALSNYGSVLDQLDRPDEALANCDKALAIDPKRLDTLLMRANLLSKIGRTQDSIIAFEGILAINPDHTDALMGLAKAQWDCGHAEESIVIYNKLVAVDSGNADAWSNRGAALATVGRYQDALSSYDTSLSLKAENAQALSNRSAALFQLARYEEALENLEQAIALEPQRASFHYNYANILVACVRYEEAQASYEKALSIDPNYLKALTNYAGLLILFGKIEEAKLLFKKALAIKADDLVSWSSKIFAFDFLPDVGFEEQQRIRREFSHNCNLDLLRGPSTYTNIPEPKRRLNIGYVSADFSHHSAASCFGPILRLHDKEQFRLICYSGVTREDDTTREFREIADEWKPIVGMPDDALATQIRTDEIDILVDLSGHTGGHRLRMFAFKPAPVQVTAWGHGGGTGLAAIDYLFSDPVTVPHDVRHLFAEVLYDLPCVITFEAPKDAPVVVGPPLLSRQTITFGCLNRFSKVFPEVLSLWARIVSAVPGARLLLKDGGFDSPSFRARTLDRLGSLGFSPDRVELRGLTSRRDHLATYGEIDIALDPFPMNGGITTWEALWMGVPVVAKFGNSPSSRCTAAILSALGLQDWVAESDEDYMALVLAKTANPEELARLRNTMRSRILTSPAGNPELYTRAVEAAYRDMWQRWCASQGT